uniref:Uncharacterized protein n=1 Tax=Physcomitrium patens TaxID=3218 RepID=A0A2K1JTM0_PHYPA|nr:hypothetical protein PHYPA_014651 [Physcomitrium patens]
MATKVHDQDDQDFAEIDIILAQAKLELRKDRCRDRKLRHKLNLSDIPENFAHVPSFMCRDTSTCCNALSVSLEASPPNPEYRDARSRGRLHKPRHKFSILSLIVSMKWLRELMGCVTAGAQDANCNSRQTVKSGTIMTGPEGVLSPPQHSSRQRAFCGL